MVSFWDRVKADLQGSHVRAQLLRFGRIALAAFVAQLGVLGSGNMTREALTAAVVGAIEVAIRQVFPVVPWETLKAQPAPVSQVSGGVVPPPGDGS